MRFIVKGKKENVLGYCLTCGKQCNNKCEGQCAANKGGIKNVPK